MTDRVINPIQDGTGALQWTKFYQNQSASSTVRQRRGPKDSSERRSLCQLAEGRIMLVLGTSVLINQLIHLMNIYNSARMPSQEGLCERRI